MMPKKSGGTSDYAQAEARRAPSPEITLPKGGGALNGLGEQFSVRAWTGTSSFAVPILRPSYRCVMTRELATDRSDQGDATGPISVMESLARKSPWTLRRCSIIPSCLTASGSDCSIWTARVRQISCIWGEIISLIGSTFPVTDGASRILFHRCPIRCPAFERLAKRGVSCRGYPV